MSRHPLAAVFVSSLAVLLPCCHQHSVTAPALQATCEAQPGSGSAPLPVGFVLSVAGAQGPFTVSISYGDGKTGTDPDLTHTYLTPGSYVASFMVDTATQSARCSTTVSVGGGPLPPAGGQPPLAVFKTTPDALGTSLSGRAPYTVRFNLCASSDPDGDTLWFLMDFDGDGHFENEGTSGAHCRKDYTYAAGTYFPRVCVRDVDAAGAPLHADQCETYTLVATP